MANSANAIRLRYRHCQSRYLRLLCPALLVTRLMPMSSYEANVWHTSPVVHIKFFAHVGHIWHLRGMFGSGTYMALT